jgi:excisionase family DNA binding protein
MLTTSEAAKLKGCSDQAIIDAISQGKIDGEKFGWAWAIKENKKFEEWQPNPNVQKSGRARWGSPKKPHKSA